MRAKFLAWCQRVQWSPMIHWQFGLSVDYDGEYEGSGIIVRLQWPGFVERWARRRLPPPEPSDRPDISDVFMASLVPGLKPYAEWLKDDNRVVPTVNWIEDRLNDAIQR